MTDTARVSLVVNEADPEVRNRSSYQSVVVVEGEWGKTVSQKLSEDGGVYCTSVSLEMPTEVDREALIEQGRREGRLETLRHLVDLGDDVTFVREALEQISVAPGRRAIYDEDDFGDD